MKIVAIIECDECHTLEETKLKAGENVVRGCRCGSGFGDEGGKVVVELDSQQWSIVTHKNVPMIDIVLKLQEDLKKLQSDYDELEEQSSYWKIESGN